MGNGDSSNGRDFEVMVASLLQQYQLGFESQWTPGWLDPVGHRVRIDFKLHELPEWPSGLCVECKAQDNGGTAWKIIAYAIDSIKSCYELPTVLIVDGTATEARKAIRYAKSRAGNSLQSVFTLMEFRTFCKGLSEGTSKAALASGFNPEQKRLFDS